MNEELIRKTMVTQIVTGMIQGLVAYSGLTTFTDETLKELVEIAKKLQSNIYESI